MTLDRSSICARIPRPARINERDFELNRTKALCLPPALSHAWATSDKTDGMNVSKSAGGLRAYFHPLIYDETFAVFDIRHVLFLFATFNSCNEQLRDCVTLSRNTSKFSK